MFLFILIRAKIVCPSLISVISLKVPSKFPRNAFKPLHLLIRNIIFRCLLCPDYANCSTTAVSLWIYLMDVSRYLITARDVILRVLVLRRYHVVLYNAMPSINYNSIHMFNSVLLVLINIFVCFSKFFYENV